MNEKTINTFRMSTIAYLASAIRELINKTNLEDELDQDPLNADQVCSSLDLIDDTDLAIGNYQDEYSPKGEGGQYLLLYGVLQALYLQQDATINLGNAFGLKNMKKMIPLKNRIRMTRNLYMGHPSKHGWEKENNLSYHYISRPTIRQEGFSCISTYQKEGDQYADVDLFELFREQRSLIEGALIRILKKIVKGLGDYNYKEALSPKTVEVLENHGMLKPHFDSR